MLRVLSAPAPPNAKARAENVWRIHMKSSLRASLAALFVTAACAVAVGSAVAQPAPPPGAPSGSEAMQQRMQRWLDDRSAIFDARLAGLKAEMKLTPDQEKLWGPFESASRDAYAMRKARMQGMMERVGQMASEANHRMMAAAPPPPSPFDRLDMMSTRMTEAAAALKKVADAGKPLYDSLDEQQKRMFTLLSADLVRMGRGPHGPWAMMGGRRGGEPGRGMEPGRGPNGAGSMMAPPPPPSHDTDEEDDSDDEV
jgi:hypothetical protein